MRRLEIIITLFFLTGCATPKVPMQDVAIGKYTFSAPAYNLLNSVIRKKDPFGLFVSQKDYAAIANMYAPPYDADNNNRIDIEEAQQMLKDLDAYHAASK